MQTYCVSCRKITENKDAKVIKKQWEINFRVYLFQFVKKQEPKGILSSLGIKTPLLKIPGLNILF